MNSQLDTLKFRIVALVVATLSFGILPSAHSSDVDPFPGVALGAEIGARQFVSPSTGNPLDGSPIITCSSGAGLGAVASGSGNYIVCIKSWRPSAEIDADAAFSQAQRDGQATAEALSQAWNQANPGQQKCFQWGPVVHANGVSTSSGGVCANPVPVPSGYETPTAVIETNTVLVESRTVLAQVESVTPPATSAPVVTPITTGLGGYAVVHPNGRVCGVMVATSSDPYNNGGVMPVEYMGCPVGSRIIFQTTPSESGNVAGWHGENVIYNGTDFVITNGSSSIVINNGTAVEQNGRSWDTGTGRVISVGTVESATTLSETTTARVETTTALTNTSPVETAVAMALATSATLGESENLDALPEIEGEEEISNTVEARVVGNRTRIAVATEWVNSRLLVTASKKGSKKRYTYRFTTNGEGDHIFRAGINLKGFTLILFRGSVELDRDTI